MIVSSPANTSCRENNLQNEAQILTVCNVAVRCNAWSRMVSRCEMSQRVCLCVSVYSNDSFNQSCLAHWRREEFYTHPPTPRPKKIRYNDNQTVIKFVMLAAGSRWASIFYSWADLSVRGKVFSKFFCLCLKTGLLFLLTDVKNGTETNYYLWCTA